jgi:hypothetical protein
VQTEQPSDRTRVIVLWLSFFLRCGATRHRTCPPYVAAGKLGRPPRQRQRRCAVAACGPDIGGAGDRPSLTAVWRAAGATWFPQVAMPGENSALRYS